MISGPGGQIMRKAKLLPLESGDHEISLTPMLDVVFFMLVFSIVTWE